MESLPAEKFDANRRTLIVGLGSPHGDDQAGWIVVDRLRAMRGGDVPAIKVRDGSELLETMAGVSDLWVIDASAPNGAPGAVHTLTWPSAALEALRPASTHSLGLVEGLRLAESLGLMPPRVRVIAIEAQSTQAGAALSSVVELAVDRVAGILLRELEGTATLYESVRDPERTLHES